MSDEDTKTPSYGPALPPHLQKNNSKPVQIGPDLPPHLKEKLQNQSVQNVVEDQSSSDDEDYGPALPGTERKSRAQVALEERALEIKLRSLDQSEEKKEREEWMTELPTVSASKLGLGPRQFRPNAGPDMSDRSSWTDIPGKEKKRKNLEENLKESKMKSELRERDEQQERMAKSHKRENESLLEIHQKKLKTEKPEEVKERKPFNRDTDLQVNKFDEAQKAAVLKKAQLLDDRFSRGKSKFL